MTSSGQINIITKKIVAYLLLFSFLCGTIISFPTQIQAQEVSFPDLNSQSAVLMEFSRGEIIFSKNGSEPLPPASLTKIMTLPLSPAGISRMKKRRQKVQTGGSQMFLE